jgi:hypothetical protein
LKGGSTSVNPLPVLEKVKPRAALSKAKIHRSRNGFGKSPPSRETRLGNNGNGAIIRRAVNARKISSSGN